ncbi:MAG: AsmA-like C-terminal region-containing protein [Candidatus Brocadiales bacterium]
MRLKKLLPIAIGGGLGGPIVVFVIIMAVYPSLFLRGIIMDQLEKKFGGRATAEEVSFSWSKGVVISDLFIQDKKGERPILKVESIYLKFKIMAFLRDKLIIERFIVNRPEMVIYRGDPDGRKGPSLDGASELTPATSFHGPPSFLSMGERKFPEIIEARIVDGTFTFTDLYTGESTRVEGLNLKLGGMKPGGKAEVSGECDIIGGGGRDHAVISGWLRGYELASLEALQGELNFTAGFAQIEAAVDMTRLDKPGTEVVKSVVKADFQKTITRLGAILALPENVQIKGNLDSHVKAISQTDGSMLIEGESIIHDLYLNVTPFLPEPLETSKARIAHRVSVHPDAGIADVQKLMVSTDDVDFDMKGVLQLDGSIEASVHLSLPLEELLLRLSHRYKSLGEIVARGDVRSDMELQGTIGDVISIKSVTTVKGLDFEAKSFKYNDPEVRLQQHVEYNHPKDVYNIKSLELTSGPLLLKVSKGKVTMGDNKHYQGEVKVACNLDEVDRLFKPSSSAQFRGVGKAALNFSGPLAKPFGKGVSLNGSIDLEEIVYGKHKVTNLTADDLVFKDNKLHTKVTLALNGAPVEGVVDADVFDGKTFKPRFKAQLDATKVPISHDLGKGKFDALITLHVEEARGEGIFWEETLKKSLTANGTLHLEDGQISGLKLMTKLLAFFGKKDSDGKTDGALLIESADTDFFIENEKVYTPKSQQFIVKGKPFDVELSGWVDFDQRIDYDAIVFLPKAGSVPEPENAAKKVNIKVTGTLSKPKAKLEIGALLNTLLKGDDVIKDVEDIFKKIFR